MRESRVIKSKQERERFIVQGLGAKSKVYNEPAGKLLAEDLMELITFNCRRGDF